MLPGFTLQVRMRQHSMQAMGNCKFERHIHQILVTHVRLFRVKCHQVCQLVRQQQQIRKPLLLMPLSDESVERQLGGMAGIPIAPRLFAIGQLNMSAVRLASSSWSNPSATSRLASSEGRLLIFSATGFMWRLINHCKLSIHPEELHTESQCFA